MIEGIFGKPGAGKTLCMLRKMHKDRFWAKVFRREIIQIANFPVSEKYFPGVIHISNDDITKLYDWILAGKYYGAYIYLDEMSILFPASHYKSIPQDVVIALRQHRHAGYNLTYTAQDFEDVAKGVRSVTQFATELDGWSMLRFSTYASYECKKAKINYKAKYGKGIMIHTNKLYNSYNTEHNIDTPSYIDFKRQVEGEETF